MKVLLVHNEYGKYSGEEAVVDKMAGMLFALGHDVAQFKMSTASARDNLPGQIKGFFSGIYSSEGVRGMRKALEREKPDVVNVHNLYPFISPAALIECKKAGVPVVMTIHNFRLICPTGLFMRDGKPCELCLQKGNEWSCIRHNCENYFLKSLGYAARNFFARLKGYFRDNVDYFACITEFQRKKLIEVGFDPKKLLLIPNAIDLTGENVPEIGDYIGFCGRLSREKGIDLIIETARRHPEISFKLAGECRDRELINELPQNVELMGYLKGEDLVNFYRNSRFMIMASRWYEGFPMSILEGAQHYKATIGPDHGGFSEIIGSGDNAIGRLFKPGDIDSLEKTVVKLWNDKDECHRLGLAAHDKLASQYSTDVISQKWNNLLNQMVELKKY